MRPAHLVHKSRAGVEGVAVLVEGDAEHIGIVPEDLLGAVAMMYIGVDYCDPLMAVLAPQVLHHYCHIVDIAEAPVAVHHAHAVVAGRPDQGEAVFDLALLQGIGQGQGAAGGDEVGLGGLALHVGDAEVDPGHVLFVRQAGLVLLDLGQVHQSLLEDLVPGVEQPLLPLRMGGGYGPVEGGEEYQPRLAFLFSGHLYPLLQAGRSPASISNRRSKSLPTVDQPRIILNTSL